MFFVGYLCGRDLGDQKAIRPQEQMGDVAMCLWVLLRV